MYRRAFWLVCCTSIVSLLMMAVHQTLQAQTSRRCFAENGLCIEGRFRQFWEQHGGLAVFGLPVTLQQEEGVEQSRFQVQWFERARFELHPENTPPYDVLLGRLGADRLQQLDRDWQSEPRASGPQTGCLWFAQTGHNVCNQGGTLGFKTYWETYGLQDSQLNAYSRSLALFGLPLTEARMEVNAADGQRYITQWFERARFEWHPNEPNEYKVLLGLLGSELRQQPPPNVTMTSSPTSAPTPTLTARADNDDNDHPSRPTRSPTSRQGGNPPSNPTSTLIPRATKTQEPPKPTMSYPYLVFGSQP